MGKRSSSRNQWNHWNWKLFAGCHHPDFYSFMLELAWLWSDRADKYGRSSCNRERKRRENRAGGSQETRAGERQENRAGKRQESLRGRPEESGGGCRESC